MNPKLRPKFAMTHFGRSSIIVAVFFGIDKVLAFIRQTIVARQFGLSYDLDVFNAANNIPDLLSALISGGALGVALIPVLSEYMETRGRDDAWQLFARVVNLAFVVTAGIAVFIALFAPWLISNVIAPGFPAEQQAQAAELMRLDLIAIMIFSISGLVMAGLQANQHFLLPALAPGLYNVGQIFGAVFLASENGLGLGIHGLVYGVIIGAALHLLIQVPGLRRYGFRWRAGIGLLEPGMRQVMRLLGPRVITKFFIFMFFIVRDNLASGMGEGAVTALNLGWFIMQVPETLLGTAIAITLLPTISEQLARGQVDQFRETMNGAVRALLAFTIPSAALLAVGIEPLVQTMFGFSAAETALVVLATRAYLVGLAGHALLEIASRAFYAQQNAMVPLYASALNAAAYVALAITLSNTLGFVGIALANSTVFTTEALILLWMLARRFPGLLDVSATGLRVALTSAGTGLALFFLMRFAPFPPFFVALGGLALAGGLALVFIWPEVKLLLGLGAQAQPTP